MVPLSEGVGSRGRDAEGAAGGPVVSPNSPKAEFSVLKFWIHSHPQTVASSVRCYVAAPANQGLVFPGYVSTAKQMAV